MVTRWSGGSRSGRSSKFVRTGPSSPQPQTVLFGQGVENDSAGSFDAANPYSLGQAVEADSAGSWMATVDFANAVQPVLVKGSDSPPDYASDATMLATLDAQYVRLQDWYRSQLGLTFALKNSVVGITPYTEAERFWSGRLGTSPIVRTVATTNVVQSGLQTINGVSLGDGDSLACVGQSDPIQNGGWIARAGAWDRSGFFLTSGNVMQVGEGTMAGTTWQVNTHTRITAGTSAINFIQISIPAIPYPADPTPELTTGWNAAPTLPGFATLYTLHPVYTSIAGGALGGWGVPSPPAPPGYPIGAAVDAGYNVFKIPYSEVTNNPGLAGQTINVPFESRFRFAELVNGFFSFDNKMRLWDRTMGDPSDYEEVSCSVVNLVSNPPAITVTRNIGGTPKNITSDFVISPANGTPDYLQSQAIGAAGHENGHCFNLPHPDVAQTMGDPDPPANWGTRIMGRGFDNFPSTTLCRFDAWEQARVLASYPQFFYPI